MAGADPQHTGKKTLAMRISFSQGALKWSKQLPNGATPIGVAVGDADDPATYEYRIYVTADDGKVYCYQVDRNGYGAFQVLTDPIWTYTCDGDPIGSPVVGKETSTTEAVYVSDDAGYVHCIDESDGDQIWKSDDLTPESGLITAPLFFQERLYLGSTNGELISFDVGNSGTGVDPRSVQLTTAEEPIVRTPAAGLAPDPDPESPVI